MDPWQILKQKQTTLIFFLRENQTYITDNVLSLLQFEDNDII